MKTHWLCEDGVTECGRRRAPRSTRIALRVTCMRCLPGIQHLRNHEEARERRIASYARAAVNTWLGIAA